MHNSDAPKAERSTRQRAAIREAIEQAGRPLLAQEVLDLACLHVPRLGIATVYRNIKAMVEEGAIKQVLLPGEPPIRASRTRPSPPLSMQHMPESL
jgi:Fe2+ or Zn2+ uptake regulation protein